MSNVVVIGATGNVGREILKIIYTSLKVSKISALSSAKSIGKCVSFGNKNLPVYGIDNFDFYNTDIAFFVTNSMVSKKYIENVKKQCRLIVDLSSYYRMYSEIPLLIPEVNIQDMSIYHKIVANPNCVVISILTAIKKLHDYAGIKKIILSTYQAVSGVGKIAMNDLYTQTKNKILSAFADLEKKKSFAFNVIPSIDELTDSGFTKEEMKIANEIQKILGADISITATCARVPVFIGHSMSINIEFDNNISLADARKILLMTRGIRIPQLNESEYFTSLECVGSNNVFVSRIRSNTSNSLDLWIVADNLRKGAALNAVQLAKESIDKYM